MSNRQQRRYKAMKQSQQGWRPGKWTAGIAAAALGVAALAGVVATQLPREHSPASPLKAVPGATAEAPYSFTLSGQEMAQLLYATEMQVYESNAHPISENIRQLVQVLGRQSLEEMVTFTPTGEGQRVEGYYDLHTGKTTLIYPQTAGWQAAVRRDGVPLLLENAYHELLHNMQFSSNKDLERAEKVSGFFTRAGYLINLFSDYEGKFFFLLQKEGGTASDKNTMAFGKKERIYFGQEISQQEAETLIRTFGTAFDYNFAEEGTAETALLQELNGMAYYLEQGTPMIEAAAYLAANADSNEGSIEKLVTNRIGPSAELHGSFASPELVRRITQLTAQLYLGLQREGYAGAELDERFARTTGELATIQKEQTPVQRLEEMIQKMDEKYALPSGDDAIAAVMAGKKEEYARGAAAVRAAFLKQFQHERPNAPRQVSSMFFETRIDGSYRIWFTPTQPSAGP